MRAKIMRELIRTLFLEIFDEQFSAYIFEIGVTLDS